MSFGESLDVAVDLKWEGYALAKSVDFLKRPLEFNLVNHCSNSPFFLLFIFSS